MSDTVKVEWGKHVIAAAKSLKRIQSADPGLAGLLYAAFFAGRAGLFASALRHGGQLSVARAQMLAVSEGLTPVDLQTVFPWLERSSLAYLRRRRDGSIESIESLVLTYDPLLQAVAELYESLDPTLEDRGCVTALMFVSDLPRPESEVRQAVTNALGDGRAAKDALSLVKNYRILAHRTGKGLPEPILFSERMWSKVSAKAAQALSTLPDPADRDVLEELIRQIRKHQGLPEPLLRQQAKTHNAEHLLDLALGVGLINRTQIEMADGSRRRFLTTSHFYADVGSEFGEDTCDRVKIFLDSIRNGQHFGQSGTGKILDPDTLLRRLLNRNRIGPCTAIETDYITSERAGIVRVVKSGWQGQSFMELVQHDTVRKVHEIVSTGAMTGAVPMKPGNVREGVAFASIEELRGELGEVPEAIAEAERRLILKLRES